MKYRKRPIEPEVVEAILWNKFGDHPDVRYFNHPKILGHWLCQECYERFDKHGWIDISPNGITVCPGNYVYSSSTFSVSKPEQFESEWEKVENE